MRAALSILGLVIAFTIVMFMMKKQAQQLAPEPVSTTASSPASSPASATTTTPEAVRLQVQGALEQAAARASEAQP